MQNQFQCCKELVHESVTVVLVGTGRVCVLGNICLVVFHLVDQVYTDSVESTACLQDFVTPS